MRTVGAVLLSIVGAFFVALLAGAVPLWSLPARSIHPCVPLGIALGAASLGLDAVGGFFVLDLQPSSLNYSGANGYVSWLPEGIQGFPLGSLVWAGGVGLWSVFTQHGTRRLLSGQVLVFLIGAASGSMAQQSIEGVAVCAIANGLFMLAALNTVLRFDIRLCWIAIGFESVVAQVTQATFAPFPGAQVGAALGILIVGILAWWWLGRLRQEMCRANPSETL